jgi:hypothetical protein
MDARYVVRSGGLYLRLDGDTVRFELLAGATVLETLEHVGALLRDAHRQLGYSPELTVVPVQVEEITALEKWKREALFGGEREFSMTWLRRLLADLPDEPSKLVTHITAYGRP